MEHNHAKLERTLDSWISADWSDGVDLRELSPLDQLRITTSNNVYTLIVVSPYSGVVEARGGPLLSEFTTVRVCGSSLGCCGPLKCHVIHPGFCLELSHDELGVIVTTPVQDVAVSRADERKGAAVM